MGIIFKFLIPVIIILISCLYAPTGDVLAQESGTEDYFWNLRKAYCCNKSEVPVIRGISLYDNSFPAYQKVEITFSVDATYTNPFDPDDINVEGHFIYPGGKEITIPAFYYVPYENKYDKTVLSYNLSRYSKTGDACWKLRFSSGEKGRYKFYITAKDAKGNEGHTEYYEFRIISSDSLGYIKISEHNPMYFEYEADNSLFYGCGSNIAWVRTFDTFDLQKLSYEYFINKAKANTTSTRVWMCHYAWLEWSPSISNSETWGYAGVNYYNQQISSSMDKVFELAESADLHMILTLDDNDELRIDTKDYCTWFFHPYNALNGGPVEKVQDYWKNPEVRRHYKNRLRYIIARWGYSTSLWTLNQWNDFFVPDEDKTGYLNEMREYVKSITSGYRPLLYGSNIGFEANEVLDYATTSGNFSVYNNKPNVDNECYFSDNSEWFNQVLQEQIWENLMSGIAASMVWPHNYVDDYNAWPVFKNFLSILTDFPLNLKKWDTVNCCIDLTGTQKDLIIKSITTLVPYGDVPNWGVRSPVNVFNVDISNNGNQWLTGFCNTLYGSSRSVWRNPPLFNINMPSSGRLLIEVCNIGSGKPALTVTLNGNQVKHIEYSNGPKAIKENEQYVEITLEAGENNVFLDNTGDDWLRIKRIHIIPNESTSNGLATARGLLCEDVGIVYIRNQKYGELFNKIFEADSDASVAPDQAMIKIPVHTKGLYKVTFFDPTEGIITGKRLVVSGKDSLIILIPSLKSDMVLKIKKVYFKIPFLTAASLFMIVLVTKFALKRKINLNRIHSQKT